MKHRLTDNWGLKLGSLLFAFFLWVIVTNMNDPEIQYRVYNVPVKFLNTNIVTDQGKTFEVEDETDIVGVVTLTGTRSVIDSLDADDVTAEADFNNLTMQNTISIEFDTNKYSDQVEIHGSIDTVDLTIEDLKEKTLALTVDATGTAPDGYMIGTVTPAQNQVRISGAESLINQVVSAHAEVSVSGFTQNITTDTEIELLDADGRTIETDKLDMNISNVKVTVEMLKTKEVPIVVSATGTPADGYLATGNITAEPETVMIAGETGKLSKVEEIDIPEDAVDLTGQTGSFVTVVNLSKYLPGSIVFADSEFDGNVTVTADIEKAVEKTFGVSAAKIKLANVPEGYRAELVETEGTVSVVAEGLKSDINSIDEDDFTITADLTDVLKEEDNVGSNYHVSLTVMCSNGNVVIEEPAQVWVTLNKAN